MRKVFATIWYHPNGKWKLNEAIVVENNEITGSAVGGSFFFGSKRVKKEVLKEALLDLLFFDPEMDEEEWEREFERIKRETEVEFVNDEEMKKLKEKYPEAWDREISEEFSEELFYIR